MHVETDRINTECNDTVFRTVMKRIPSSLPEKETWKSNVNGERKQTTF